MSEYFLRSILSLSMKTRVIFSKIFSQPHAYIPANNCTCKVNYYYFQII